MIKAKIDDLTFSFGGKTILSLEILKGDIKPLFDDLKDKDLSLELKEWKEKRSLDANGYFWVLCDKLAVKMNLPKEEIYKQYIKNVGGNAKTVCVQDKFKESLVKDWESHGIGWVCEDLGASKLRGCSNVTLYSGSSTFDTASMARLIDLIVQDCKSVGIETMTPAELARIKEEWK